MGKGVWGIDVSKYSVKAVRLEGPDGSLQLTNVSIIPYPESDGGETPNLDEQIRDALRELKEKHRISGEPIVFSLPSHSTFNRLIKLPPVEDAKIPEIVRYEAQSQIPFNIEEVIWNYQYVDRKYEPGEEKEVILFAIKKDIVEQFLGNIAELNFNVEAVQFGPVALFNFLVKDQDTAGAACVALDMGGDNTDLIVIDGTKFWVRNLPITGNDVTKALQKAFNIPFAEAEKLKLKAGQSQQAQKIFNAIQPVLRDLVNEINRSIGYYKSISKTSKFDKILLLGNSTKTLNFQKFVSQSLQLPAARVQKLNTIQPDRVDAGELNEGLATIGTALGLALQGIGDTANRVNLLPPAYLKKKEIKKKQPFVIGAAAALYILVGAMWLKTDSTVKNLRNIYGEGDGARKLLEAQIKGLKEAQKVDNVREPLKRLAEISSKRDRILEIMNEINPNIPNNGNDKLPENQKLYVVAAKFEEVPAIPETRAPGQAGPRPYPTQRILRGKIEVVITKRGDSIEESNFIRKTLLNYDGKRRIDDKRACVVLPASGAWKLADGQGLIVEPDNPGELSQPWPKDLTERPKDLTDKGSGEKKYKRYIVSLEIPVSEEPKTTGLSKQ